MSSPQGRLGTLFTGNVAARIGALVALGGSTLLVARTGGPAGVGVYALLRVLPGLVGVVLSAGLPGAAAYFLAGPSRGDRRLATTLLAIAVAGGLVGTLAWSAGAPVLRQVFFKDLPVALVALAGLTVLTQLVVAAAKACSQGSDDMAGSNWVILFEEAAFLPAYGALALLGMHGGLLLVTALLAADVATSAIGWTRLTRRRFFAGATRPSLALARDVAGYGLRGQVGGVMSLLNLRLDFAILDAIAGPATLGTYAIASKFAELLRIPTVALAYVLYPSYARDGGVLAGRRARALLPKAGAAVALAAIPIGLAAGFVLPAVYGEAFRGAVAPTRILLIGLAAEGVAAVATGYLYGVGRPGLNSLAMAAGVAVTVAMDLLLIPSLGAIGAAWASTGAYLATSAALLGMLLHLTRGSSAGLRMPAIATEVR